MNNEKPKDTKQSEKVRQSSHLSSDGLSTTKNPKSHGDEGRNGATGNS